MGKSYDFSGWATRANVKCSDGRMILNGAFKDCDGKTVPLVWNHQHNDPNNILGHALLKDMGDGVYAYCSFNDSESGRSAKLLVEHGDISSLSILANQLVQRGSDVIHGVIREVSLVLAGANPKAFIDSVMTHGDDSDEIAIMYFDSELDLQHGEIDDGSEDILEHVEKEETIVAAENRTTSNSEETIGDVFNTLTDKQKTAVYAIIGDLMDGESEEDDETDNDEGGNEVKHNVFEGNDVREENVLSHDAINTIIGDAKRFGSMKESVLQHAETYGIDHIDYLFPEAKTLNTPPEFIQRDMGWVQKVMGAVHHSPFSKIKSMFADITEDDARAKGYMKGKLKKEEVFSLLKRTTTPTTVYKKQKMDRDDVIDITDFDVIAWLKREMRMMLDEELARAFLIGDGRLASSDDKINESNIRPIMKEEELFAIQAAVTVASAATADDKAKMFIRTAIKARKDYKGSGQPTLFTTEDLLTDMLLLEDSIGHALYADEAAVARKLRVKEIVTVPVMEGITGKNGGALMGIIVNLADYNVGADKGGSINMFEDFDIDYNQQKYLIETRCSGALTKPYSAIVLEEKVSG